MLYAVVKCHNQLLHSKFDPYSSNSTDVKLKIQHQKWTHRHIATQQRSRHLKKYYPMMTQTYNKDVGIRKNCVSMVAVV